MNRADPRKQAAKAARAIAISILVLSASGASAVSPFVDPDGIGAEAPDMLIPEKIVSSCQPGKFWISLNDPIVDNKGSSGSSTVEHPLTAAGSHAVSCKHGDHAVEATLRISPPGDGGMCSATHFIKITVKVNRKFVIGSAFANYCTGWGITSIKLDSGGSDGEFRFLSICGYWPIPAEIFEPGASVRTFKCEKFPLGRMIERELLFTDGEVRKL